jgi:hypothetical protein
LHFRYILNLQFWLIVKLELNLSLWFLNILLISKFRKFLARIYLHYRYFLNAKLFDWWENITFLITKLAAYLNFLINLILLKKFFKGLIILESWIDILHYCCCQKLALLDIYLIYYRIFGCWGFNRWGYINFLLASY